MAAGAAPTTEPSTGAELPAWWRSRAQRWTIAGATIALCAVGFLPLFAGPTYEFALACGLVLPSATALATARDVAESGAQPIRAFARGLTSGFVLALVAFAVALLHGARAGFCDPLPGVLLVALGPGAGALMGGTWGACAGLGVARLPKGRRRSVVTVLLALLGPLIGVLVSVARFYTSPMVFAFDPFFGYFAGPLYDTVLDPIPKLVTYRAGSACTVLAAGVLALCGELDATRRLRLVRPVSWELALLGGLAALASALTTAFGPKLHHYSTPGSIREALGATLTTSRCRLYYSSHLAARDMRLLGRECDAHVAELERFFEVRQAEPIAVYVFSSLEEKRDLMGAATTQIAKPWRHEIYIQAEPYPHPVIGHELAHVVSGSFGRGPFRVAGPLGGWLPDPGRIEGIAVAASPPADSELSLAEWAKAMLELGLLPPLDRVFRLSFLGENSAKAYTVAGAFVSFFKERYGATALRDWYGGKALEAVTGGESLAALERDFRSALAAVRVEDKAMIAARARFDRPAIFGRACPHAVDELEARGNQSLGESDPERARELFEKLLKLDPDHPRARLALGLCAVRQARFAEAEQRFTALARDPALPRLVRASGEEALGDLELVRAKPAAARTFYDRVSELALDGDRERTLDVKRQAVGELEQRAILNLLIGGIGFGPSWDVAGVQLGQWLEREPERGVAPYLLGKNFYGRGRFELAEQYLDRALDRDLVTPSIRQEALRVRVLVACALGKPAVARTFFERWRGLPELPRARVEGLERFMRRCDASGL